MAGISKDEIDYLIKLRKAWSVEERIKVEDWISGHPWIDRRKLAGLAADLCELAYFDFPEEDDTKLFTRIVALLRVVRDGTEDQLPTRNLAFGLYSDLADGPNPMSRVYWTARDLKREVDCGFHGYTALPLVLNYALDGLIYWATGAHVVPMSESVVAKCVGLIEDYELKAAVLHWRIRDARQSNEIPPESFRVAFCVAWELGKYEWAYALASR